MRLLVTRPQPDADISAERLRAMGHDVFVSPVLETSYSIEPLDWHEGDDLVVTSRNGLRALAPLANDLMKETARLYTVGDATAKLAQEAGFQNIVSASGDVDNLVEVLSAEAGSPLIYVCGKERRGDLDGRLSSKGHKISVAVRYEAAFSASFLAATERALKAQKIEAVLHYSKRSASAFLHLMQANDVSYSTKKLTHFCLAKNIVTVFDKNDEIHILVADEPNEKSLFEVLTEFCNGHED